MTTQLAPSKEKVLKEFTTAFEESALVDDGTPVEEQYIEFKLDGRVMRSYTPHEGQLTFMMAAMGRGQTSEQRFAAIINIMISSLRDEDAEYLESRLLTRDPKERLSMKTIEGIFEHLAGEWFATPTQPQSDSAGTPPTTGPKSKPRTTKSTS